MSFVRRSIAAVVLSIVAASQAVAQVTEISVGTVGGGNALEWPLYIAEKKGFLEQEKLALEWVGVQSSAAVMQQVAAGSLNLGTTGLADSLRAADKGGLVVIAQIEQVGRTAQVVTRKDLNLSQVSELKGRKVANQTGSSVGNIFTDVIAPAAGLKKGDFQEVRMDVNNMVAAMAAKTVDAMVNVEPYNEIAVAEGIGTSIMDYSKVDKMPVFMAATPDFVDKNPDTVIAYLKCWQEAARDFKDNPGKVADVIYAFFTSKGYAMSRETFAKALAKVEVDPGFPSDLVPGLQKDAEVLLREKKISAIPDWNKALRPELWAKARG